MLKHVGVIGLAAAVVLALAGYSILGVVSSDSIHLIQTFGKTTAVRDGRTDAGLYLKWPWPVQSSVVYDGRLFTFDEPASQVTLTGGQSILATLSCTWRIAEPKRFYQSTGSTGKTRRAETKIRGRLRGERDNVLAKHSMGQFVNVQPELVILADMEKEILANVAAKCREDYGVEIVAIGIKTLAVPQSVSDVVIEAVKEERQTKIRDYKGTGEAQATRILELAKQAETQILEFARAKASGIRSKGELAATKYYDQFKDAPDLVLYLRKLEALEESLRAGTTLILTVGQLLGVEPWWTETAGASVPASTTGGNGEGR